MDVVVSVPAVLLSRLQVTNGTKAQRVFTLKATIITHWVVLRFLCASFETMEEAFNAIRPMPVLFEVLLSHDCNSCIGAII